MKTILFYGDSNTYGYDPRAGFGDRYGEEICWTERLKREAGDSWEILADGMNGRQIPADRFAYQRVENLLEILRRDGKPDWFAVMLGTNDLFSAPVPDPADFVCEKMSRFLDFVREKAPAVKILLITPPRIGSEESAEWELRTFYGESRRLADRYRGLAIEKDIAWLDAFGWNLDLAYDGVHLSEEGHRQFAEHMLNWLRMISR